MKLIIAIVNSDDSSSVQAALTEEGYFVTKLSTTGGFLKKGNTTFFIGTNDDKVEHAVGIIKENSKKRVEKEPTVPPKKESKVDNDSKTSWEKRKYGFW